MDRLVVVITTSNQRETLQAMAEELVVQRAAACAQVGGPIVSTYEWEGKLEKSEEWTLTVKTLARVQFNAIEMIQRLHNYEVPEIIVFEPAWVAESYLRWAVNQINQGAVSPTLRVIAAPDDPHEPNPNRRDQSSTANESAPVSRDCRHWHLFLHGMTHPPEWSAEKYGHWPTLAVKPAELREPMPIEFEALCNRLQQSLGVHCEPDGAFAWHPQFGLPPTGSRGQTTAMTGTIHCADQRVMGIEMFAQMNAEDWERFIGLLPEIPWIAVQIMEAGVFVSPATISAMLRADPQAVMESRTLGLNPVSPPHEG